MLTWPEPPIFDKSIDQYHYFYCTASRSDCETAIASCTHVCSDPLDPTCDQCNGVTLWTMMSNVVSGTDPTIAITSGGAPIQVISNMQSSITYYFIITARNALGWSLPSIMSTAISVGGSEPSTIAKPSVEIVGLDSMKITWVRLQVSGTR